MTSPSCTLLESSTRKPARCMLSAGVLPVITPTGDRVHDVHEGMVSHHGIPKPPVDTARYDGAHWDSNVDEHPRRTRLLNTEGAYGVNLTRNLDSGMIRWLSAASWIRNCVTQAQPAIVGRYDLSLARIEVLLINVPSPGHRPMSLTGMSAQRTAVGSSLVTSE
jgi:hypothetical protein